MASLNQVVLIGNLTRDPELKYLDGGSCVANCAVAVNEKWTNKNGEKQESVTFVEFECWGRTGEVLNEYCKKGKLVCLVGKLKLEEWDDRETGKKRSKLKVNVLNLQMIGGREEGPQGGGGQRQQGGQQHGGGQRQQGGGQQGVDREPQGQGVDFDDIPFAFLISCIMGIGSAIMGA